MGYAYVSSGELDQLLAFGGLEVGRIINPRYILATIWYLGYRMGKCSLLKRQLIVGAGDQDTLRKELLTSLFAEFAYDVWDQQIVLMLRIC